MNLTSAIGRVGRCRRSQNLLPAIAPTTAGTAATAPPATPKAALQNISGQRSMPRPLTHQIVVARPTNTPLCGSRKACSFLGCELLLPVQAIRSSFTARTRFSIYSRQRARLTTTQLTTHAVAPTPRVEGLYQLGCTRLFSPATSIGITQRHWSLNNSLSRALFCSSRAFPTNYPTMAATRLDGTAIAKRIRERLAAEIVEKQKANPKYQPCLKIIQGS